MGQASNLLDDLNVDEEFKKVLIKLINCIENHFTLLTVEGDLNNKLSHLSCAEFHLRLIEDCYLENQDFQRFINFIREDINDRRFLVKKNSFEVTKTNKTIH